MRRRRRGMYPTSGPVKPPKVAKVKPVKIVTRDLEAAYKKLLSGSTTARVQALYEALNWWDLNIPVFLTRASLDSSGISTYEKANKARALGVGSGSGDEERETALRHCIKLYEKLWAAANKLPTIAVYLERLEAERAKLEAQEAVLRARHEETLGALQSAFSPIGMKFQVQKSAIARQFDGINTIILSEDLCKVLMSKARSEGMLSVLFSEAITALKAASVERNDDGSSYMNVQKLAGCIPSVLSGILQYCDGVPRGKVFKAAPDVDAVEATVTSYTPRQARQPREPKVYTPRPQRDPNAPKVKRTFGHGPMVGGMYRPGSSIAIMFQRLEDFKPHELADVASGLNIASPMERLKWIIRHGKETGKWRISVNGSTVQMHTTS